MEIYEIVENIKNSIICATHDALTFEESSFHTKMNLEYYRDTVELEYYSNQVINIDFNVLAEAVYKKLLVIKEISIENLSRKENVIHELRDVLIRCAVNYKAVVSEPIEYDMHVYREGEARFERPSVYKLVINTYALAKGLCDELDAKHLFDK